MSNLAFLGLAVGLSVLGLLVLWLTRRRPRSMQAGMEAFTRELQALAPPEARANRHETHVDRVSPAPIRPRPTGSPSATARRTGRGPARRDLRPLTRDEYAPRRGIEPPGSTPE
jgi:hypothetical protein